MSKLTAIDRARQYHQRMRELQLMRDPTRTLPPPPRAGQVPNVVTRLGRQWPRPAVRRP